MPPRELTAPLAAPLPPGVALGATKGLTVAKEPANALMLLAAPDHVPSCDCTARGEAGAGKPTKGDGVSSVLPRGRLQEVPSTDSATPTEVLPWLGVGLRADTNESSLLLWALGPAEDVRLAGMEKMEPGRPRNVPPPPLRVLAPTAPTPGLGPGPAPGPGVLVPELGEDLPEGTLV